MDNSTKSEPGRAPLLTRRSLGRIGIEIGSIVLGVLLALAVSEWQTGKENAERMRSALENVRGELNGNLRLLETIHGNNAALVDALGANPAGIDDERPFTPAMQVSSSAWQALSATGLAHDADLGLLVSLAQTYALIDIYRRMGYSLVDADLAVRAAATAADQDMGQVVSSNLFAVNFANHFRLIVDLESALIEAHQRAIAALTDHLRDGNR